MVAAVGWLLALVVALAGWGAAATVCWLVGCAGLGLALGSVRQVRHLVAPALSLPLAPLAPVVLLLTTA